MSHRHEIRGRQRSCRLSLSRVLVRSSVPSTARRSCHLQHGGAIHRMIAGVVSAAVTSRTLAGCSRRCIDPADRSANRLMIGSRSDRRTASVNRRECVRFRGRVALPIRSRERLNQVAYRARTTGGSALEIAV